jgi:putative SOS response-associated peptidase YedK
MCGRFVRAKLPEEYSQAFELTDVPSLPSYNIAPTQNVVAVRMNEDRKACVLLRWGLIPFWAKDAKALLINARAETLAEKPSFRTSFQKRRCLILADGYYEWKTEGKKKSPFYFRAADDGPIAFAGVWDCWKGGAAPLESCAIVTTGANELSRPVHDRMPVILRGAEARGWLNSAAEPRDLLELLRPFPADALACYPVQPLVNSVKNNGPLCIEPAAAYESS